MSTIARFRLVVAAVALAALALVPIGMAAQGKGKPGGSCTRNPPGVSVQNNWAWSQWGSWGLPGQQLTYSIAVRNYDIGCGSSSFVVGVSAPSGFSVSMPTSTISLKSSAGGYLTSYITSTSGVANGDYPVTVTVTRAGSADAGSPFTSYYKVYSSDSVAPTLYWPNPGDGTTVSGRKYNVVVSAGDDHAVKKIDLYMDGAYKSTATCDNISYVCQLYYPWSVGASGSHTATFKAEDWLGNVGVLTVNFTVS